MANIQLDTDAELESSYHSIRCKLGNDAVWEHLFSNPTQAAHVRELEIMRENPSGKEPLDEEERIPPQVLSRASNSSGTRPETEAATREQIAHSEGLLIRAIHNMVNLDSFTWDRWVPVINQGDDIKGSRDNGHAEQYREDIWTALRDCTQIKRLKVADLGRRECCFTDPRPIFDSTVRIYFQLQSVVS